MQYHIEVGKQLLIMRVRGDATLEELISMLESPVLSNQINRIIDFRHSKLQLSYTEIRSLVTKTRQLSKQGEGCWVLVTKIPQTRRVLQLLAAKIQATGITANLAASTEEARHLIVSNKSQSLPALTDDVKPATMGQAS